MSDQEMTGAPAAAPSEPLAAPAPSAGRIAADSPAPIGVFGTARGSGLARGKRPTPPAASSAASSNASYKPTSIEVITPQREYTNPFTGERSVSTPVVAVPVVAPAPVSQVEPKFEPVTSAAPAPGSAIAAEPVPTPPPPAAAVEISPALAAVPSASEKPALNILPPAESKHVAQNWENRPNAGGPVFETRARREERQARPEQTAKREPAEPKFQPRDPRDAKFQPRDPRENKFDPREPRREPRPDARSESREPRAPRPPTPIIEPPAKSGGFLGWLKGLFGGQPAAAAPTPATEVPREERDGRGGREGEQGPRRRHRGGRGRGRGFQPGDPREQPRDPRDQRAPREGQFQPRPEGAQPPSEGGPVGEDGFHRRRRRGGRGRNRGDRGQDPRSEGTQGGGAI